MSPTAPALASVCSLVSVPVCRQPKRGPKSRSQRNRSLARCSSMVLPEPRLDRLAPRETLDGVRRPPHARQVDAGEMAVVVRVDVAEGQAVVAAGSARATACPRRGSRRWRPVRRAAPPASSPAAPGLVRLVERVRAGGRRAPRHERRPARGMNTATMPLVGGAAAGATTGISPHAGAGTRNSRCREAAKVRAVQARLDFQKLVACRCPRRAARGDRRAVARSRSRWDWPCRSSARCAAAAASPSTSTSNSRARRRHRRRRRDAAPCPAAGGGIGAGIDGIETVCDSRRKSKIISP